MRARETVVSAVSDPEKNADNSKQQRDCCDELALSSVSIVMCLRG